MEIEVEQFDLLRRKLKETMPGLDEERLVKAFEYAREQHKGQLRKDGSPYITHPIATAEIVAEMGLDEDSIIAAILHDCIEDTPATYEEIEKMFGTSVAVIVDGVTKLTKMQFTSKEEEQMENLRKMLMAMAKDIRVILIKIADRLHNMRTLQYQNDKKRREKSLETMEIYAPIAHRLGMQKIKWELEDLSLMYLDPVGYNEIKTELRAQRVTHEAFMDNTQKKIEARLRENGIECTVYGRIKHVYSIYRKMYEQDKKFSEVLDLYAFRVIVNDIADCYNVLGHIHDLFKPIPGRFKDYIGTPKPNMYQSLHTTVIGSDGVPFEVQIRTWDMHHTAEYGIAAHWKYKQGIDAVGGEEKFAWIRRLLEAQQDTDSQDFVKELKVDMFADEVFVFTPGGDVINLPAGATPIDFAYSIHSEVGNHMTGATVNGRIVPFNHVLQNGDIVEIITSPSAKGPSRDWMNIVKSAAARTKIRQWLKKEKREENIVQGKASFEAELKRAKLTMSDITAEDVLPAVLKRVGYPSLDELFATIGYGGMTALRAVNKIKDVVRNNEKTDTGSLIEKMNAPKPATKAIHGIVVEGLDNCLVKFSRCCTPIPGDGVVGFVTRGYGVSIHRADCSNYLNSREREDEKDRWVKVDWAPDTTEYYQTTIEISARDRNGLVMDLATVLNAAGSRVRSLSARDTKDGNAVAFVSLEVRNLVELRTIMSKLQAVSGVTEVKRTGR